MGSGQSQGKAESATELQGTHEMQSQCQRCLQMGSEQVHQVSHDASTHMEKLRRCTDGGGWGVSFLVSLAPRRHF